MSTAHRLFIAIPVDNENQKKLMKYQQDYLNNLCFWSTSKDSLHLTLIFLGENDDLAISNISKSMDEIAKKFNPFSVKLNHTEYGPTPTHQRLVWIKGEREKTLQEVKNELQEELYSWGNINFQGEHKGFIPHITLAKIKNNDTKSLIPLKEQIETELPINIIADKIVLFESKQTKHGFEYSNIYQSFFNKD